MAENTKKTGTRRTSAKSAGETAAEKAPAEKTYTEAELNDLIAAAVAKAMAAQQTQPQVVQVAAEVEKVQFLYMAEVADDNVYEVGPGGMYGRVVGKIGSFYVPKSDLSRVMDGLFRLMLEKRWIIPISGLNDEEREAYGVDYRDGEVLDKRSFANMLDLGDELKEIFPKLCKGHREMVEKRIYEAFLSGDRRVTRALAAELNKINKQLGSEAGGFAKVIEMMNEAEK